MWQNPKAIAPTENAKWGLGKALIRKSPRAAEKSAADKKCFLFENLSDIFAVVIKLFSSSFIFNWLESFP